jgi:predicted DCC family thiol-disulfide oxidoreductase YuxK
MYPILLYDGSCAFCDGAIQFVLRHDRRGRMCFAPLDGEVAHDVAARHPELSAIDSLVLVEHDTLTGRERISIRSEAALRVATYLGGLWHSAILLRVVPRGMRDWAYDSFARRRYRLFGHVHACALPASAQRERFLR